MEPVLVVPATPTTQMGSSPSSRSRATISARAARSMHRRSSVGTRRSDLVPMPSSSTALVSDECASAEQYTVRRRGAPATPPALARTSNPGLGIARHGQSDQVRGRAPAREQPAGAQRVPEQLLAPVQHLQLDVVVAHVRVDAAHRVRRGGQHLGDHPHRACRSPAPSPRSAGGCCRAGRAARTRATRRRSRPRAAAPPAAARRSAPSRAPARAPTRGARAATPCSPSRRRARGDRGRAAAPSLAGRGSLRASWRSSCGRGGPGDSIATAARAAGPGMSLAGPCRVETLALHSAGSLGPARCSTCSTSSEGPAAIPPPPRRRAVFLTEVLKVRARRSDSLTCGHRYHETALRTRAGGRRPARGQRQHAASLGGPGQGPLPAHAERAAPLPRRGPRALPHAGGVVRPRSRIPGHARGATLPAALRDEPRPHLQPRPPRGAAGGRAAPEHHPRDPGLRHLPAGRRRAHGLHRVDHARGP